MTTPTSLKHRPYGRNPRGVRATWRSGPLARFQSSLPFALMICFLALLWLAGGASRGDAFGQVVVRASAWLAIVATILFAGRPVAGPARGPWIILIAAIALTAAQLIPLPPALWTALPGRSILRDGAALIGDEDAWRPLAMVPGATTNALGSLVVPLAILVLAASSTREERARLGSVVLGLVAAAAIVGLLQFSGAGVDNPLVNEGRDPVRGMFANRNHFALFMAMGILVAPAWAFQDDRRARWRGPVALGLAALFALTILASGSRAGIAIGLLALVLALLIARQGLRAVFRRAPRWMFPMAAGMSIVVFGALIAISITLGRAESIDRALLVSTDQDMRARGLATILSMIGTYFPFGTGFGGFDPLFRIHEPKDLLQITYFNHAHNDYLELALDGGLPAVLLLLAAIAWLLVSSARAWRVKAAPSDMLPRLGSGLLLLVLVASAVDYPARTPMIMALVALAAVWLGDVQPYRRQPALPDTD